MKEKWSMHIEWAVLMITIIGSVYVIDTRFEGRIQRSEARTDRLYEMFIDLVKEGRR